MMENERFMDRDHESIEEQCLKLLIGSLDCVDPHRLVAENVRIEEDVDRLWVKGDPFDLSGFKKIHVLGAGKGAPFLYSGLKELLGKRIAGGVIVSLAAHSFRDDRIRFFAGSHPIPDEQSLRAGEMMVRYVKEMIHDEDLVIFLITGGASSLMVLPRSRIALKDIVLVNTLLLGSGADIQEINCIRKSLSSIKGGKLAEIIHPAKIITLAVSDVPGSSEGNIGSGPTVFHDERYCDLPRIIKNHFPGHLVGGKAKEIHGARDKKDGETEEINSARDKKSREMLCPEVNVFVRKQLKDRFSGDRFYILGKNSMALDCLRDAAEKAGLPCSILSYDDSAKVEAAAERYADLIVKEASRVEKVNEVGVEETSGRNNGARVGSSGNGSAGGAKRKRPIRMFISGGELTVNVTGSGVGGRNQEFILSLMINMRKKNEENVPFLVFSLATDGIDGPTDAAGAWADEGSYEKARKMGLSPEDFLKNNDSHTFFRKLDQLIVTGPTRTNVMDIRMVVVGK